MRDIKASILSRGSRKYWYVRYQIFFENSCTEPKEESTKILKTEKNLEFMQHQYLPAWISRYKNESQIQKIKSKKFEFFADIFLNAYEQNHDFENMRYRLNRILVQFSGRNIDTITKLEVRMFCDNLRNSQTNDSLSKNSKLKYLRVFRGVFELAKDHEILERNPAEDIKFAGSTQNLDAIEPFFNDEVQILLEKSKDTQKYGHLLHLYLGIAFHQGMSPAEIIGLQVGDIDLKKQIISIKRNVTKGVVKETKTVYRNRDIPLFSSAITFFVELIERAKMKKSIWLFSDEHGKRLDDIGQIRGDRLILKDGVVIKNDTRWALLIKHCSLKYRDLKNCRHTFAVSALESKAFTMQEVANMLGHASLQMLIKHYARYLSNKALSADKNIDLFGDTFGDTDKKVQSQD